jgi:predicted RNase H-like HicB family nuclease
MKLMRTYTIVVEPEPDGGYFVTVPGTPQLLAVTVAA